MNSYQVREIEAKTGLSRAALPDPFFTCLYRSISPYRGCTNNCAYCDGRAEKYFVEGEWGNDIEVRTNVARRISEDIDRGVHLRESGSIGTGSGISDVYQDVEAEYGLTRQTLQALVPAGLPVCILTKNALVERDYDILSRFPSVLVMTTITTVDPDLSNLLEPGASSPQQRLGIVSSARERGFSTGVMAMPLCPFLTDTPENTHALFTDCAKAGAQFIYPGSLTLRPGRQKEHYFKILTEKNPSLVQRYTQLYGENRQSGMPRLEPIKPLMRQWNDALRTMNMPSLIPHSIFKKHLSLCDTVFVLLCHMDSLYAHRGIATDALKRATKRYATWLSDQRTQLRRKRIRVSPSDPFPITRTLDDELRYKATKAELMYALFDNERLAHLISSLILNDSVFDYPSLSQMLG